MQQSVEAGKAETGALIFHPGRMRITDAGLRIGPPRLFAVTEAVVVQVLSVNRSHQSGGAGKRPLALPNLRFPGRAELGPAVADVTGVPHQRIIVDCGEERRNDVPGLTG